MKHSLRTAFLILNGLLFSHVLFSQSIYDLDAKRGYKEFKLGDSFQKWENSVQVIKADGLKKQCLYNGNCCNTLFNNNVEKIDLIFSNNVLVIILIELETWDKPTGGNFSDLGASLKKYDILHDNFKLIYNNPTRLNNDSDIRNGHIITTWQTNKTYLTTNFDYLGAKNGCSASVMIGDVANLQADVKKDF